MASKLKKVHAVFYASRQLNRLTVPVRDWLPCMANDEIIDIGLKIKVLEFSWPIVLDLTTSLVHKVDCDLWEIQSVRENKISRVIFTVDGTTMLLLHGFVGHKKSLLLRERGIALERLKAFRGSNSNGTNHLLGSSFDYFLFECGLFNDVDKLVTKVPATLKRPANTNLKTIAKT